MATPKVSFSDLEDAFQNSSDEHSYWLDKQTGRVILLDSEVSDALREGEDLADLPDWQREMAEEMTPLLRALGELTGEEVGEEELNRFVEIPQRDSSEAYEVTEDFVETVTDSRLRDLLVVALRGKGAFRRFKNRLLDFPAERERWFRFSNERLRHRIKEWAEGEGVAIDFSANNSFFG